MASSLIFIISQLGLPLVRFGALFFPYWAGQISPSIAPRIGCAMALNAINIRPFSDKIRILAHLGLPQATGGSGDGTSICINHK